MISCFDGFKSLKSPTQSPGFHSCLSTDCGLHSRVILLKHVRPHHFSAKNHPLELLPFRHKAKVLTLAFKLPHSPILHFSDCVICPSLLLAFPKSHLPTCSSLNVNIDSHALALRFSYLLFLLPGILFSQIATFSTPC